MRKPFLKKIEEVAIEGAHGNSGKRRLLLSKADPVSSHLEAMTKGHLPAGGLFDWHQHDGVDEFFLVLEGSGVIEYKDGTRYEYKPGDLIYNPADLSHRIENTSLIESVFYFIRLDA